MISVFVVFFASIAAAFFGLVWVSLICVQVDEEGGDRP